MDLPEAGGPTIKLQKCGSINFEWQFIPSIKLYLGIKKLLKSNKLSVLGFSDIVC